MKAKTSGRSSLALRAESPFVGPSLYLKTAGWVLSLAVGFGELGFGREADSWVTVELDPLELAEMFVMPENREVSEGDAGFLLIDVFLDRVVRVPLDAIVFVG